MVSEAKDRIKKRSGAVELAFVGVQGQMRKPEKKVCKAIMDTYSCE